MPLMNEIVGQKGAYSLLNKMYTKMDIADDAEIASLMRELNVSDELFSDLTNSGLFIESPNGFYISSVGKRVTLLLRAINDEEEISEVFQQLKFLYPSLRAYELITEDITNYFIENLYSRPDFIRVLICSPWIRLDENHLSKLHSAILKASAQYKNLQIRIITLPPDGYLNWSASIETFKSFRSFGGEIMAHCEKINNKYRLHTKLYIVEPGPYGGAHYAIIGSENLTGRRNIELSIKIENDNEILRKLNLYFYEIWQESQILKEE